MDGPLRDAKRIIRCLSLVVFAVVMGLSWAAAGAEATTMPAATTQPSAPPAEGEGKPRGAGNATDLTQLSLEDLMNVQVTSVSKQAQKISDAPAAVTVIGQDDIERSGMGSIPELLRLAPEWMWRRSTPITGPSVHEA